MSKLIKKATAVLIAVISYFVIAKIIVSLIEVVEEMRIAGEISNLLACILGGLSAMSVFIILILILIGIKIYKKRINNAR